MRRRPIRSATRRSTSVPARSSGAALGAGGRQLPRTRLAPRRAARPDPSTCARTSGSAAATSPAGSSRASRETGCPLAIEVKKIYMDEWTGGLDDEVCPGGPRGARGHGAGGDGGPATGGAGGGPMSRAAVRSRRRVAGGAVRRVRRRRCAGDRRLPRRGRRAARFLLQVDADQHRGGLGGVLRVGLPGAPRFTYRPLAVRSAAAQARAVLAAGGGGGGPGARALFREKQEELDIKITMLRDRGAELPARQPEGLRRRGERPGRARQAPALPPGSRQPWSRWKGASTPPASPPWPEGARRYREMRGTSRLRRDPRRPARHDGLRRHAARRRRTHIPKRRAEALIQHEVGVHLVTRFNGSASRSAARHRARRLRRAPGGAGGGGGVPGGGALNRSRCRILAARVLAVEGLCSGADFVATFRLRRPIRLPRGNRLHHSRPGLPLRRPHQGRRLSPRSRRAARHLGGRGPSLEPLLVGKIELSHLPRSSSSWTAAPGAAGAEAPFSDRTTTRGRAWAPAPGPRPPRPHRRRRRLTTDAPAAPGAGRTPS